MLVFDTLPGPFIGIALSLLLLLYRASKPYVAGLGELDGRYVDLDRHPDAKPPAGIALVRVEGGLYFANAEAVRAHLLAVSDGAGTVILDAETIPFVDVTAAQMLDRVAADLRRRGVRLVIARDVGALHEVNPSVRAAVIARGG